ncbi:putative FSP1 [Ilyonectria destructans]|nr:putative FSP1 [Ilyonectria destructans]
MGSLKEHTSPEAIAIVGLSCKFAGEATDPGRLWALLAGGRDAWSEIPSSRFKWTGSYHPNHEQPSTMHVRAGHFLDEDIAKFDAAFFNFSAETASSSHVAGSNTSVYMGAFNHDYRESMIRDEDNLPRLMITGTGVAMASNRVSHFFDLKGASMTLDTGCSTGLVALHQAVQSLRSGESDMSVVGSSNLMLNPDMFKALGSISVLSPDGKSYSFDSRANGYGRGEGVATLVVKRLKDAIAAGDPVRAVIRETVLNQDGKTETITSPSQVAQEELIRKCYRNAGVDPRDTQYFEAHGTGTPTGDPIEVRAVASVFQPGRTPRDPLLLGSVKASIGHTEPVSGLASVIKVVLALERGLIPPSIHFDTPNAKLDLDRWHIKVPKTLEPWNIPRNGIRRASINNFGYGGTNAHMILESGDSKEKIPDSGGNLRRNKTKVLILSARDEQTCKRIISNLRDYLSQHSQPDSETFIQSLIYTLGQRRSLLPWVAAQSVSYTRGIDQVIKAIDSPKFKPTRASRPPRIGMVFTGQGAQWHAMGRELIIAYPKFKMSLEEGDGYLRQLGADWSLMEELSRDANCTRVNDTALSIPICTALQVSLVRLLRSWGITPTAVTSHSSGEIAAAYTAGAISYQAAVAIAYHRSVLAANKSLRGSVKGAMVAIGVGQEESQRYLQQLTGGGKAMAACINSPRSVTIAGDLSAVHEVEAMAKNDGVFAARLKVDIGYHSHHMAPIEGPYLEALGALPIEDPQNDLFESVAFSSPVTGSRITSAQEVASPNHWAQSLVQPVQFLEAFTDMVLGDFDVSGSSVDVIVEVGPHTALRGPIRQIQELPEFSGLRLPYFGCLSRNSNARDTLQTLAVNLVCEGCLLDLESINFPWGRGPEVKVLTDLPIYPWNHEARHWVESRFNKALRERAQPPHDLLGSTVLGTNTDSPSWRHILRTSDSPWIRDHVVQSNILYPGAGFACLAIEAVAQITQTEPGAAGAKASRRVSGYRLRDVDIMQALLVPDNADGVEVQTKIRPVNDKEIGSKGWKRFEIFSVTADNYWAQHAKGLVRVEFDDTPNARPTKLGEKEEAQAMASFARRIDPDDMFASFRSVGINHGPTFQNLRTIFQSYTEQRSMTTMVVADTSVPHDLTRNHVLHPTTLDSIVQAAYTAVPKAGYYQESPRVPRRIERLWVSSRISHEAGHLFKAYSAVDNVDAQGFKATVTLVDDRDGGGNELLPLLEIRGLEFQSLGQSAVTIPKKMWEDEICNKVEWAADMSLASPAAFERIRNGLSPTIPRDGVTADLRPVCIYFIQAALEELARSETPEFEGHLAKFYSWMQHQVRLASSGRLGPSSGDWLSYSPSERVRRINLSAMASVTGEMVCLLGPYLVAMLRGERAPLELMMEAKLLNRYYGEQPKLNRCFTQLATLLRLAVHKNPRVRILEIGAGTGSVTRHALQALGTAESGGPRAASYHYTDVSMGFFEAARDEFSAWSDILAFDKLDIEQDPAAQGFTLGNYDIVIACQVLHATKSISRTLANVHSLMKANGTLLLIETTQDQIDIQFVFGLLPGWWLSEDEDRKKSPSLSVSEWDQALKSTGFTGVDVDAGDCQCSDTYAFSTILSRVKPTLTPNLSADDVVLVTGASSTPPPGWITLLQRSIADQRGVLPAVHAIGSPVTTADTYGGKICVFIGEMTEPALFGMDSTTLEGIKLFAANCRGLLWVTAGGSVDCENPCMGLAAGFMRSLRNEYVGRPLVTLDLDPRAPRWSVVDQQVILRVLQDSFDSVDGGYVAEAPLAELEYAERDGAILIPRYFKDAERNKTVSPDTMDPSTPSTTVTELLHQQDRRLSMKVGIRGLLDTIAFEDDDDDGDGTRTVPPESIEIETRAYGLNFRDVMVAMNQLEDRIMGIECSGVITRVGEVAATHGHAVGDAVFCLLRGPFGSRVQTEWWNAVRMPEGLTFEEAASLPMIFTTAYTALVDVARLQRGQSVLIHAAAGGVGQAAMMLAQHLGAEIFVTVGTASKRSLMMQKYGIPANRIFNSRDASFAAGVLAITGGRGVDVVLNSLAGPLLQESFNLVAPFGHFVEIGKRDLEQSSFLELRPFTRQVSFSSLDILAMTRGKGRDVRRILTEIARLTESRVISPVGPPTTLPIADISKAFRLLQAGKHMGKIVLSASPEDTVPVRQRQRKVRLSPDASYLLVGGVGGIGRCVANWLVAIGAKNLILLSRSARTTVGNSDFVQGLAKAGCRVEAISCDISRDDDLTQALRTCQAIGLPAIRGVIQAAMVLQDSVLEQMTLDRFQAAILPKINGTWNLHGHFQHHVDFFIMLSSINGIVGYASQTNYSAGGSYQDALARWRVARGFPAVSIDLCAVKTVGYVAETKGVAGRMQRVGHRLLREDQLLGLLESAIMTPFDPQVIAGLNTGPGPHWNRDGESQLGRDPRFIALQYRQQQQQRDGSKASSSGCSLASSLAEATSRGEAESLVTQAIAQKLSDVFMVPVEEIDPAKHPSQYGVDSLVAVELRNMLSHQAAAEVSIFSILQSPSLSALASEVVVKSRVVELS